MNIVYGKHRDQLNYKYPDHFFSQINIIEFEQFFAGLSRYEVGIIIMNNTERKLKIYSTRNEVRIDIFEYIEMFLRLTS